MNVCVIGRCPSCAGDVTLKQPHTPGRQAVYCSRRCHDRAAKRRQRGRRSTVLDGFSDEQLARIPQRMLEPYGIVFGGGS